MFHHICFIFRRLQSFADLLSRQAELRHTVKYEPELNLILGVASSDAQNVSSKKH